MVTAWICHKIKLLEALKYLFPKQLMKNFKYWDKNSVQNSRIYQGYLVISQKNNHLLARDGLIC